MHGTVTMSSSSCDGVGSGCWRIIINGPLLFMVQAAAL
jgi:hypothetical protein